MNTKKSDYNLIIVLFSAIFLISSTNGIAQSSNRGESYYKQQGYQTFALYNLAFKAPVKLADISYQTKHDFSLEYGGIENQNNKQKLALYQLIINRFPAGYNAMSKSDKITFKQQMIKKFSSTNPTKKVIFGADKLEGYITQYTQKGYNAKGIIFIKNDCIYSIVITSNDGLEQRFNTLTNNIYFF